MQVLLRTFLTFWIYFVAALQRTKRLKSTLWKHDRNHWGCKQSEQCLPMEFLLLRTDRDHLQDMYRIWII